MQTSLDYPYSTIKHPSRVAAEAVINDAKDGTATLVYKVTQAGASTGILATNADKGNRTLVIGPTVISVSDVLSKAVDYCEDTNNIYYGKDNHNTYNNNQKGIGQQSWYTIPGNHRCEKYKEDVKKYPDLKQIPLPLEDCKEGKCEHFGKCECTRMLDDPNITMLGITKAKLGFNLLVEKRDEMKKGESNGGEDNGPSLGTLQLELIRRKFPHTLIDECHMLEVPDSVHIQIYTVKNDSMVSLEQRFASIIGDSMYPECNKIIKIAKDILSHPRINSEVRRLVEKSKSDTAYSEVLSFSISNPGYMDMHELENLNFFMGATAEWKELIIEIYEGNLDGMVVKDVLLLRDWLYAIGCKYINLLQYRKGRDYIVGFTARDMITEDMVRGFIRMRTLDKRKTFFTSATIGEFNYNSLLPYQKKVRESTLRNRGDPAQSCDKQIIIPDSYQLQADGRYSLYSKLDDIASRVFRIAQQHGAYDCVIVSNSAIDSRTLRSHPYMQTLESMGAIFDYYRSPTTQSTTYGHWKYVDWIKKFIPSRVLICVGGAETPSHCMDVFCKGDRKKSLAMRKGEIYKTRCQTFGRVKNSENSIVYCIGINEENVRKALVWGPGYKIVVERTNNRYVYTPTVSKQLASPVVKICEDDDARLLAGRNHMKVNYVGPNEIQSSITVGSSTEINSLQPCRIVNISPLTHSLCKESVLSDDCIENYNNKLYNSVPFNNTIKALVNKTGEQTNSIQAPDSEHDLHSEQVDELMFTIYHENEVKNSEIIDNDDFFIEADTTEARIGKSNIHITDDIAVLERQLIEAINKILVRPDAVVYKDGILFVWDVFCYCRSLFAKSVHNRSTKKWVWYPVKVYNQKTRAWEQYHPMEYTHVKFHVNGESSYGVYHVADDDTVANICWDIDAHYNEKANMSVEEYERVKQAAHEYYIALTNYLRANGIPFIVERSGSPGSFHIWVICKPVSAAIAHWFGNAITKFLGYAGSEVNPKQSIIKTNGSVRRPNGCIVGNLVKLPLGINLKNKNKSYVLIDGYWMRYKCDTGFTDGIWEDDYGISEDRPQSISVQPIDISKIAIPEYSMSISYQDREHSFDEYIPSGIRDFVRWGLTQVLEGPEGHQFRVVAVYELLFNGSCTVKETIDAFRTQRDFNELATRRYVEWVVNSGHHCPYGPNEEIPEKVRNQCPNIIACYEQRKPYIWTDYFVKH